MDLYEAFKPVFVLVVIAITAWRAIVFFGKNQSKAMWVTIILGAALMFVVASPEKTLNSFSGIGNTVLNFIQGLGG